MARDHLSEPSARWLDALDFAGETAEIERRHRQQMESLLLSLTEVLDSIDRLLEGGDGEEPAVAPRSVGLIAGQLQRALAQAGLEPVSCLGETADPQVHEIVAVRSDPDAGDDLILGVERRGWRWNGQLLRRPRVVVARNPSKETKP